MTVPSTGVDRHGFVGDVGVAAPQQPSGGRGLSALLVCGQDHRDSRPHDACPVHEARSEASTISITERLMCQASIVREVARTPAAAPADHRCRAGPRAASSRGGNHLVMARAVPPRTSPRCERRTTVPRSCTNSGRRELQLEVVLECSAGAARPDGRPAARPHRSRRACSGPFGSRQAARRRAWSPDDPELGQLSKCVADVAPGTLAVDGEELADGREHLLDVGLGRRRAPTGRAPWG